MSCSRWSYCKKAKTSVRMPTTVSPTLQSTRSLSVMAARSLGLTWAGLKLGLGLGLGLGLSLGLGWG